MGLCWFTKTGCPVSWDHFRFHCVGKTLGFKKHKYSTVHFRTVRRSKSLFWLVFVRASGPTKDLEGSAPKSARHHWRIPGRYRLWFFGVFHATR